MLVGNLNDMNKILCIVLFTILLGCKQKDDKSIYYNFDNFSNTVKLTHKKAEGISQLSPSKLCVFDSIIMVVDYLQNPRLHFYKKKDLSKKTEYGFIGEGPEEFNAIECNCQVFKDVDTGDRQIMIYEFGYGIAYKVNLSGILRKDKTNKTEKFHLNPEIYNADNLFYFDDIAYGEATNHKTVKYFKTPLNDTTNFTPLGKINSDEALDKAESVMERSNLDRSFMAYSNDNQKFIAAYLRYNKIILLDKELNEDHIIYFGNKEIIPKSKDIYAKENVFYYETPFAGKKGFFVPFIGAKTNVTEMPQEIHFFNYLGEPLIRYVLDMPIISFTVDEDTRKIYAITESEDTPFVTFEY